MADCKKPGWVFWTTVVLVGVPVLYVASFGPACWITAGNRVGDLPLFMKVYVPFGRIMADDAYSNALRFPKTAVRWWACLGVNPDTVVRVPINVEGSCVYFWSRNDSFGIAL